MSATFGMTVKLENSLGKWRLRVEGRDGDGLMDVGQGNPAWRDISAEEALRWCELVHPTAVRACQAVIRKDADAAEASAKDARQRSKSEAARLAESAVSAQERAVERRREADRLAPTSEQPPPFRVE